MNDNSVIILVVSREILEGAVLDRNAAFISNRVVELGYRVRSIQVVDREEGDVTAAIRWSLEKKPAYVMVTGGLGPSFDDSSRSCAAKAIGLPLREDSQGLEQLRKSYQRLYAKGAVDNPELNEERRRMAQVPAGSTCIENPIGTGPAVQIAVGETQLILLPGVPAEMQRLFLVNILPQMTAASPNWARGKRQVDFRTTDESSISQALRELTKSHPEVSFRTRVLGDGESRVLRIEIVAENEDQKTVDEWLNHAEAELRGQVGNTQQLESRRVPE